MSRTSRGGAVANVYVRTKAPLVLEPMGLAECAREGGDGK